MADPGWFPDPENPSVEVYFDGHSWTTYRRPAAVPPPPAPPAPQPPQWQAPAPQWGAPPAPATPTPATPAAPAAPVPAPPADQPTQQWAPVPAAGPDQTQWLPPATGEWQGAATAQWAATGAPAAPPARRRRPLLLALAAAVVLVAGLITWLAWPGEDKPKLTYEGKAVDGPDKVLTAAEASLQKYVTSRHGAQNDQTRCYFTRPESGSGGGTDTDVDDRLTCGPVLFVDGETGKPYVSVPLHADAGGGTKATLSAPATLSGLEPEALPTDRTLVRPDAETPPSGTGGLAVPDPPAADKGVLLATTLGPTAAPGSLTNARVVGKSTGFVLPAAGEVPRYGSGDDARSAPAGQKLFAFQIEYVAGDVTSTGSARAEIVVDGGAPKQVPETAGSDEWVVVAASNSAVLQLRDAGYTQTLSLPDGRPGSGNLAVLARRHRTAAARKNVNIPVRASNGSASADLTLHARMTVASLDFWAPGHDTVHAPDGRHALLTANLTYTRSGSSSVYGFEPALLRLRLPNGQVVRPRNVARANRIFNVFTVPASFTTGTLQVTGSERIEGVTLRVTRTTSFPISIPAG